jgi:hypothetical protein
MDVTKNASSRRAVPMVPAANVIVPTTNAATPPLRVRACARTAASAITAATTPPRRTSFVFRR